jgi:hypothetical protein
MAASPLAQLPLIGFGNSLLPSNTTWVYVGSGSSLNAGEGFTMKGTLYQHKYW